MMDGDMWFTDRMRSSISTSIESWAMWRSSRSCNDLISSPLYAVHGYRNYK